VNLNLLLETKYRQAAEPIKPAPPVTNTLMGTLVPDLLFLQ